MNIRYAIYLSMLLMLSATIASAQAPVLTADNFPQQLLGQEVTITAYEATDPGSFTSVITTTGEDQTWDIASGQFEDPLSATFQYVEPPFEGLVGAEAFLNADPQPNFAFLTMEIVDPEQFPDPVEAAFYQHVNSERILNYGFAASLDADQDGQPEDVFISFNPPTIDFLFPTTFGDSWTNDYEQVIQAVGVGSFSSNVSETNEIVGWGTLVTPMGSVVALQQRSQISTTIFGVTTPGIPSLTFVAPFQEVTGKSELVSLQADATLSPDGSTVTSLSYSTVELEGGGNPTAAEDVDEIPAGFAIHQNFPNPFNPSTMIEYSLDRTGDVAMTVHDILGRQVGIVVDGVVSAGRHSVRWEAGDLPSGFYQVRMTLEGETRARSMVLQK